jgi:ectoine hydroxylase-related dioxygenase (phytanoyl-CoA dioxygenase family)
MDDDKHLLEMKISGYCILKDVVPADSCTGIREHISRIVERERLSHATAPRNVGFVPSIINHDQSFAQYLTDKHLLSLVTQLLGSHVRISFTSAIVNEPGNARGGWHADWPFNQKNAGHLPAPYLDAVMHLTTLWMFSPFEVENGGTLVVPGSHRFPTNPTAIACQVDPEAVFPGETHAIGPAGSVLVMDSRLWHATAANLTGESRVALAVRYAPWWLNLEVLRPNSDERRRMCDESGLDENVVPSIRRDVFNQLPSSVQPMYRHWIERAESSGC